MQEIIKKMHLQKLRFKTYPIQRLCQNSKILCIKFINTFCKLKLTRITRRFATIMKTMSIEIRLFDERLNNYSHT